MASDPPSRSWMKVVICFTSSALKEVSRQARMSPSARRAHLRSSRSQDRKSTRLNSSHSQISYAVFCLKKKNKNITAVVANILIRFTPCDRIAASESLAGGRYSVELFPFARINLTLSSAHFARSAYHNG